MKSQSSFTTILFASLSFATALILGCSRSPEKGADNYTIVRDTVIEDRIDTIQVLNADGKSELRIVESYDAVIKADTLVVEK